MQRKSHLRVGIIEEKGEKGALPLSLFPLFFNNSYTEVALSLHFLSEVYLILSFPSCKTTKEATSSKSIGLQYKERGKRKDKIYF
jgi:hypothetical protein